MKLAQLAVCAFLVVTSACSTSNPRSQPLPEDLRQAQSDPKVQAAAAKLTGEEKDLLGRYIKDTIEADEKRDALAKGGPPAKKSPHAKTIGEAIDQQRKDEAEVKAALTKNKATEAAYASLPKAQVAFCRAVNSYQDEYAEAKAAKSNELKLSQLRTERKQDIERAFTENPDGVVSWIGTITRLRTGSDGKASIQVSLACEKPIKLSNIGEEIAQSSPLYATFSNLDKGKKVAVSGKFFPSDKDTIEELSLTEAGSMTTPEFRFQFTGASPAP